MKGLKSSNKVGFLVLLISGFVCKILGAFFRIPLTNLLGVEGIGIFQLIMSLYAFALVVTCGGVTNSLAKLISSARAKNDSNKIYVYLYRAIAVGVSAGLIIGLLFLIFGKYICIFQSISNNKSYMLFILLLPLGAILSALRGFFQGYENMVPTAVSQILEQVFKFSFGLLLAQFFAKESLEAGVFGAFLGIVLSEAIALLFLVFVFLFKRKSKIANFSQSKLAKKEFDKANLLLTFSASILPLVNAFDALIIVPQLQKAGFSSEMATQLFGLQTGIVGAILNLPLIISMAVVTSFLPNISFLLSRGSGGKKVIQKGLNLLFFLILPTTFGSVAISKQLFVVLYNGIEIEMLNVAFDLMFYGAFAIILTAIMQYLVMLLQANGNFKYILLITALGGIFKVGITFMLAPFKQINIFALVLGNIAMVSFVCIFALIKLKKHMHFSLKFFDLFVLLFATTAMFLTVYTFVNCDYFGVILNLILSIILGVVVYFVFSLPFVLKMFKKPIGLNEQEFKQKKMF